MTPADTILELQDRIHILEMRVQAKDTVISDLRMSLAAAVQAAENGMAAAIRNADLRAAVAHIQGEHAGLEHAISVMRGEA